MKAIKKERAKNQKKQQLLLAGLGSVIALFVLYQSYEYFWKGPAAVESSEQSTNPNRVSNAKLKDQKQTPPAATQENQAELKPILDFKKIGGNPGDTAVSRNLFDYPPPPPPPPPEPPKPVTVPISGVSPSSVYARTKPFELIVRGSNGNFTPEMKIYINGSSSFAPTRFVNSNELRTDVPAQMFSSAQQMKVEVKFPGREGELFSNPLSLNILEPPSPQTRFTMLGRIAENGGGEKSTFAIMLEGDERKTLKVGDKMGNTWKVIRIDTNAIVVEDVTTAIGVQHTLKMKEDNKNSGQSNAFSPAPSFVQQQVYQPPAEQPPIEPVAIEMAEPPPSEASPQQQQAQQPTEEPSTVEQFKQRREEMMKRRQEFIERMRQQRQVGGQPGNNAPGGAQGTEGIKPE